VYGGLDISVSGMVAQKTRLDVIASNLANSQSILDADGEPNPYRRKITVFQPGDPSARDPAGRDLGVHVAEIEEDTAPFVKKWDPSSPYAKPEGHEDAGYVYHPNVNSVVENINAMDAVRAYEANVMAAEATKSMIAQALRLIA